MPSEGLLWAGGEALTGAPAINWADDEPVPGGPPARLDQETTIARAVTATKTRRVGGPILPGVRLSGENPPWGSG